MVNFKDVKGYEGKYVVTEDSKVYKKGKTCEWIEVAQVVTGKTRYKCVNLKSYTERKLVKVHRIVAEAFIPKVEGKDIVDHIDGDKFNNHYTNLRWVDSSENSRNMKNNIKVGNEILLDMVIGVYGNRTPLSWFRQRTVKFSEEEFQKNVEIYNHLKKHNEIHSSKEIVWWGRSYKVQWLSAVLGVKKTTILKAHRKYHSTVHKEFITFPLDSIVSVCHFHCATTGKYLGVSEDTVKRYLESTGGKLIWEQWCTNGQERHYKEVMIGGVKYRGTLGMLSGMFGKSKGKVVARMREQGMSLEEALTTPTLRVDKWKVDGKEMKTNEITGD